MDGEIVVERELARPFSVEQVGKPERWFALDSTLEGDGFELPVPREMTTIFEPSCFWFL